MKKRVISFMFAMVFVCIFSTAGFAYNVDAWAGITGGKNAITCSAHASTNCPLSALSSSDGEFDIYQDGRNIYYSQQHDKTSFSDTWQIKNPEHVLYECAMTGNFFYINLPADKQTWTDG